MKLWLKKGGLNLSTWMFLVLTLGLYGCEATLVPYLSEPGRVSKGKGGIVVADEPQAVLVAKNVLDSGGTAADAAVAMGFALSVTYQSAAGLGGGGICLVKDPISGQAEVLDFAPSLARERSSSARWQVSVPALPRGLFALHSKHGKLPWQALVVPAENLARFGFSVSKAFAAALATSSSSLANDPVSLSSFSSERRAILAEGERYSQLDLAVILGRIRGRTPGDFYAGGLAIELSENADFAGASLGASDLRQFAPVWRRAERVERNGIQFDTASKNVDMELLNALLLQEMTDSSNASGSPFSTTSFVIADVNQNVVACTLTMVEPFGTGILLDQSGFLLAPSSASPAKAVPPMIAVIGTEGNRREKLFSAATGGSQSISTVAKFISNLVLAEKPMASTSRIKPIVENRQSDDAGSTMPNAIICPNGLNPGLSGCSTLTDPIRYGYGIVTFGDT